MIIEVLKNLASLYYPKNICPWTQKELYFETTEYKRLLSLIEHFNSEEGQKIRNNIMAEFDKDTVLKDFEDFSRLDHEDRCYTFFINVVEGGEMYMINLYLSFLAPYYVIKVGMLKGRMLISQAKIDELERENLDPRKVKDLVLVLENIIEKKFLYSKFPKEILNNKIEDFSFQDSYLGEFNMFNAFFNNQVIYLNENDN